MQILGETHPPEVSVKWSMCFTNVIMGFLLIDFLFNLYLYPFQIDHACEIHRSSISDYRHGSKFRIELALPCVRLRISSQVENNAMTEVGSMKVRNFQL